jgi:hypothetical protein
MTRNVYFIIGGLGTTEAYFQPIINHFKCIDINAEFILYNFDIVCPNHEFKISNIIDDCKSVYTNVYVISYSISCYCVCDAVKYNEDNNVHIILVDPPTTQPSSNKFLYILHKSPKWLQVLWDYMPKIVKAFMLYIAGFLTSPWFIDYNIAKFKCEDLISLTRWYLLPYHNRLPIIRKKPFVICGSNSCYNYQMHCPINNTLLVLFDTDHHMIYRKPYLLAKIIYETYYHYNFTF